MRSSRIASTRRRRPGPPAMGSDFGPAQNLRRVVEENLVHDARFERRPVQLAAGLDHQRQALLLAQPLHQRAADRCGRRGPSKISTFTPRLSSALRRSARRRRRADHQPDRPSRPPPSCESSGMRSCESSTTRNSGRLRGRPRAIRQQAIVRQHGADARQDGVGVVPQLLHVRARRFAGDPAAIVVRRGDLAVQRQARSSA